MLFFSFSSVKSLPLIASVSFFITGNLVMQGSSTTIHSLTTKVSTSQVLRTDVTRHRIIVLLQKNIWLFSTIYLLLFTFTGVLIILWRCCFKARQFKKFGDYMRKLVKIKKVRANKRLKKRCREYYRKKNKVQEMTEDIQRETPIQVHTKDQFPFQQHVPKSNTMRLNQNSTFINRLDLSTSPSAVLESGFCRKCSQNSSNNATETILSDFSFGERFLSPYPTIPETSLKVENNPQPLPSPEISPNLKMM